MMGAKETQTRPMTITADPLPTRNQARVRILIVDDSLDVLHDLHVLLEISGNIEVAGEASNGLEAVQLATKLRPDVVVMDLEMPGMNGYEATRRIKAQRRPPRVVILSVHGEPEVIDRARRAGADGFILKGTSHEVLVDAILAGTGSPGNKDPEKGSQP